ncbi:ABC transporter permease, partial [candidate division KSB1 bacterium]|nr:ABC transporter permease [candidate division KSB1 bacterium]NIR69137.1 ABC transporter permease [candidate division KSB1 bacterium]NIS25648.1 ABC transporter permease [candidate division KSB1 bacterium]NIT72516.1 ABC transporter permease [candidate division KSB1 bacterium]NIU26325.1 ABC transporter permease [candidate division KSB1 bacterium]
MRRSLTYFWRINLAVVLAAAVATAVLTGALLVGDSVRGSLRDLTLDRLGEIDHALITQKYFRENLARGLAQTGDFKEHFDLVAPAVMSNGTAIHDKSGSRASNINLLGMDERFTRFYESSPGDSVQLNTLLQKPSGQIFPSIVINQSLKNELDAQVGDQILLSFAKPSDIARASLLGSKETEDVVETSRCVLSKIIPDEGIGRFGLRPHQTLPLNAYVSLPVLQNALERNGEVNAIVVSEKSDAELENTSAFLQDHLARVLKFEDLGLTLEQYQNTFSLATEASILSPQMVKHAKSVADTLNLQVLPIYTYLANTMEANGRLLPYSTVTAIETPVEPTFGNLTLINGQPAPELSVNEILLNEWAAEDLQVSAGDTITMSYFVVGPNDDLFTQRSTFRIKGVVKLTGLAADRNLTPDFPGIATADDMSGWDPPFPIDLSLIRPKDEAYWDKYRGTPKAFVSLETGKKLWSSRFGHTTSLRFGSSSELEVSAARDRFKKTFLENLDPEQVGFVFQPVKEQGLRASTGATDFSGLFVGFSLFLIVAAALLVGLIFRLGVEQRASEIGTLLSVGYPVSKVRKQFLAEGGLLAILGGLLGTGGAIFYAWVMMVGLRTWWQAAVGSPFLFLHVTPLSLILGYVISLAVIVVSIWLGFRKLSKIPPPALLAGVTSMFKQTRAGRTAKLIAMATLLLAVVMTGSTFFMKTMETASPTELFFGVGTLLLISGLTFFYIWLRTAHKSVLQKSGMAKSLRMAVRNTPRNPGRSMLSAALVGCACFVIVAVGANRREFGREVLKKDSGAGGYTLIAESDIPIHYDLNSEDARFELGFSDEDAQILEQSQIMAFRLLPGEDASCLNLYRVQKPRIIGVPQEQIRRGGFEFTKVAKSETNHDANPWSLLNQDLGPNIIPAFGDANSVQWILHSGLGQDIVIADESGEKVKLRFVGLIAKSIFQSEVLISEENFLKHWPSRTGYSYFLIETPRDRIQETAQILESTLSDYGFDAT